MTIRPFEIEVPRQTLDDLRDRLDRTRWTDEVNGAGWDYGTKLGYLQELCRYWRDDFDWREQEARLNAFSHFKADVDGLGIHFVHERGKGPDPTPLLLTHGWPDSFYRFHKLIPMLTDPERFGGDPADSFDVIVPSVPGYGFSDRPRERGVGSTQTADLSMKLMKDVLGYERFAAHGGDIGSGVTEAMAGISPESIVGIHLTDVPYWHIMFGASPDELSEVEREYLQRGQELGMREGAYAYLQSTKPQTPAHALNDSPAGLAAWILEKFRSWSDCDDVEKRYTKDELLTNITIYWVTETIGSSFRMYYEGQTRPVAASRDVPAGVAIFPRDIVPAPREFGERVFNIERWTEMPRGGHFAALEEPELLAGDIREFFRPLRASSR
jgi:microsomal epoxide hydrolase